MDSSAQKQATRTIWQRTRRAIWLLLKAGLVLVGLYVGILIVGLIPVNNDFQPTEGGIEIYVISNPVHADIVVPIKNEVMDWAALFGREHFANQLRGATHMAIGWGDQGFYVHTPQWEDLKLSTAAYALLYPSPTCLHVGGARPEMLVDPLQVSISEAQYQRLVEYICNTARVDDQRRGIVIPGASYGQADAFFEAHGNYHCLNTCNSWAGRALRYAGVKTPWLTPMPKTVGLYLPQ